MKVRVITNKVTVGATRLEKVGFFFFFSFVRWKLQSPR